MKIFSLIVFIFCVSFASCAVLQQGSHIKKDAAEEYLALFEQALPLMILAGDSFIEFVVMSAHIDQLDEIQQQLAIQIMANLLQELRQPGHHKPTVVGNAVNQMNQITIGNLRQYLYLRD